jgi:hypothetical protein
VRRFIEPVKEATIIQTEEKVEPAKETRKARKSKK